MKLVYESGPRAGQEVSVEPGRSIVIGRDPAADIFLDDAKVSRPHARVWVDANGGARIEDMKSTNGTFVNGQRIEGSTPLRGGDSIGIGNTRFSIPAGEKVGAATVVAGSATVVDSTPAVQSTRPTTIFLRQSVASANRTSKIAVGIAVGVVVVAVVAVGYWFTAGRQLSNAEVVAAMKPSVVHIRTNNDAGGGRGTGWVLDADKGLIVTNNHVINGMTGIVVSGDGITSRNANIVASAPCDDIAVIHVDDKAGLSSMKLTTQERAQQGDEVFSLGFPMNASAENSLTVTDGNVAVLSTTFAGAPGVPVLQGAVQHTAKIAPGNSGGPLVDRAVELVGMNTAGGDLADLNYAVGVDRIKELVPGLSAGNGITWTGLGLRPVEGRDGQGNIADPDYLAIATALGLSPKGDFLEIAGVAPGTPAQGLENAKGLLIAVDGKDVSGLPSYCEAVAGKQNGFSSDFLFVIMTAEGPKPIEIPLKFR